MSFTIFDVTVTIAISIAVTAGNLFGFWTRAGQAETVGPAGGEADNNEGIAPPFVVVAVIIIVVAIVVADIVADGAGFKGNAEEEEEEENVEPERGRKDGRRKAFGS